MNALSGFKEVPNTISELDDLWNEAKSKGNYREYLISLDHFLESLIPKKLDGLEIIDSGISHVRDRIKKLFLRKHNNTVISLNELDILFDIENIKALLIPGGYRLVTLSVVQADTADILGTQGFGDTII